jgi:pimeloyl-ACP methyl ester carboxylesterase
MKTILFVPGYYGSTLLDADSKEKIWISLGQALFNKNSLAAPIPGVDVPGLRELIPGQMLEQVTVFMAYGKMKAFFEKLAAEKGWNFRAIPYDWRKDPLEGIRLIGQAVDEAKQSDQDEVHLIGHSQGAWLCAYYLRYGTQDYFADDMAKMETWEGLRKVDKVVLATAPFRGTMGLLRNTFYGVPIGPNSTLQSPLAFSMNPSTYYLLPPKDLAVALDENLNVIRLPLHQAEFWRDNNLGLFRKQLELSASSRAASFEFLKTQLARAARLHEMTLAPANGEVPRKPLLYFTGHGRPTVEKGLRHDEQYLYYPRHLKKLRPEVSSRVVNVDGDGTLTSTSQALPPALMTLSPQIENIKMEHLELLHHPSSQKKIAEFLLSGPLS